MVAPAIELVGVSKHYGNVQALDDVSLAVRPGEVFGFLGPNGAGKTTAIRILFDLIRPSAGEARVLGIDCTKDGVKARSRMGYLPGELRLYDSLTGSETVRMFGALGAAPADEGYVEALCHRLDFDRGRRVSALSRGNRQKLGLILALMHRPPVVVLDEPTGGLDPLVQEEVAEVLLAHADAGNTVFLSSHILSEVERLCQRVAFVRHGRLVAVEEVADLKGRSLHILEVTFAAPPPPAAFDLPGVREIRRDGSVVHLEVKSNLDAVLKALACYTVRDLRTEQGSLEDVFLAYYQDDGLVAANQ